ncbi:MAG: hypothetical protein SFU91_10315 [Chloroherpetonaceae bacterium]|nr:hypothetical protein [Chloroherpetonaceae bacterium]
MRSSIHFSFWVSNLTFWVGLFLCSALVYAQPFKLKKVNHVIRISNLNSYPDFRFFVFYPQSELMQSGDEISFDATGSVIRKKPLPFELIEDGLVYSFGDIVYAPNPLPLSEDSLLAIWRNFEIGTENVENIKKLFQSQLPFLSEPNTQAAIIDSLDDENPAIAINDLFELQWSEQDSTFELVLLSRQYEFDGGKSRIASELELASAQNAMRDAARRKIKRPTETIFSDRNGKRKVINNINGNKLIQEIDEPEQSSLLYIAIIFPVVFGLLGWYVVVGRKKWIERNRGSL